MPTRETQERVLHELRSGATQRQAAEVVGVSRSVVRRIADNYGLTRRSRLHERRPSRSEYEAGDVVDAPPSSDVTDAATGEPLLPAQCWCRTRFVLVPKRLVMETVTLGCGRAGCSAAA